MTYDEISKVLFNLGFTDGISNIRIKQEPNYKLVAFFSNKDEFHINEIFISIKLKEQRESLYAFVVKAEYYKQLETDLEKVINVVKVPITKFIEEMNNSVKELKDVQNVIKEWS